MVPNIGKRNEVIEMAPGYPTPATPPPGPTDDRPYSLWNCISETNDEALSKGKKITTFLVRSSMVLSTSLATTQQPVGIFIILPLYLLEYTHYTQERIASDVLWIRMELWALP